MCPGAPGMSTEDFLPYHDGEWGYPVTDDRTLYEKLCLESFQSGLAWITVLRKRDAFRRAFHNFEPEAVVAMTSDDVERLLGDASIIRHRAKIESAINNARQTVAMQESQSLASFVWAYEPPAPQPLASQSPESVALSKVLKETGLGPPRLQGSDHRACVQGEGRGCKGRFPSPLTRPAWRAWNPPGSRSGRQASREPHDPKRHSC